MYLSLPDVGLQNVTSAAAGMEPPTAVLKVGSLTLSYWVLPDFHPSGTMFLCFIFTVSESSISVRNTEIIVAI